MGSKDALFLNPVTRELIVWASDILPIRKDMWCKFQEYLVESWPTCDRQYSDSQKHKLYRDFLRVYMRDGFNLVDYFSYAFVSLSKEERGTYISEADRGRLHRIANNEKYNSCVADKVLFDTKYKQYVLRDWMVVNGAEDKAAFMTFFDRHGSIVVKPRDGQKGAGVDLVSAKSQEEKEKIWKRVLEHKLLVEEVILQYESIAAFHPESVNTVRISTAIDKQGKVHLMSSVIRVGNGGSNVDNGSAGGLFCGIDIESGMIISPGIDLKARRFLKHPTTGQSFLGFIIPRWEELKKLAVEVALVTPQLRYIGWDWVLTKDGRWELLEGNEPGGVHILQQGVGRGLKKEYETVLLKE